MTDHHLVSPSLPVGSLFWKLPPACAMMDIHSTTSHRYWQQSTLAPKGAAKKHNRHGISTSFPHESCAKHHFMTRNHASSTMVRNKLLSVELFKPYETGMIIASHSPSFTTVASRYHSNCDLLLICSCNRCILLTSDFAGFRIPYMFRDSEDGKQAAPSASNP